LVLNPAVVLHTLVENLYGEVVEEGQAVVHMMEPLEGEGLGEVFLTGELVEAEVAGQLTALMVQMVT